MIGLGRGIWRLQLVSADPACRLRMQLYRSKGLAFEADDQAGEQVGVTVDNREEPVL